MMHPPYFKAITQRPVLKLPNNARVAVWVVMNVEPKPYLLDNKVRFVGDRVAAVVASPETYCHHLPQISM